MYNTDDSEIRIAGVISDSIVDGPGLRLSIFVQGCPHNCEGCHNPETHDFNGGVVFDTENFSFKVLDELRRNPILAGVTFSGGEPVEQAPALLKIARAAVEMGKDVVLFTGYTYEQLLEKSKEHPEILELLSLCVLLIDGRFVLAERSLTLKFRGSTNQRLIDPKKSLETGETVLWKSKFDM